jgi:hypothetical protein
MIRNFCDTTPRYTSNGGFVDSTIRRNVEWGTRRIVELSNHPMVDLSNRSNFERSNGVVEWWIRRTVELSTCRPVGWIRRVVERSNGRMVGFSKHRKKCSDFRVFQEPGAVGIKKGTCGYQF